MKFTSISGTTRLQSIHCISNIPQILTQLKPDDWRGDLHIHVLALRTPPVVVLGAVRARRAIGPRRQQREQRRV